MNRRQEEQQAYFNQLKFFIDEYIKIYNITYTITFTEEGVSALTFKRGKYEYTWFMHLNYLLEDGKVKFYILHQMLRFISDILVIGRCESYE